MNYSLLIGISFCLTVSYSFGQKKIFETNKYSLNQNSVREGKYEAVAPDDYTIKSNYDGVNIQGLMRPVSFKFSINGLDNERAPSQDHSVYFNPVNGKYVTPVFKFAQPDPSNISALTNNNDYLMKKSEFDVVFRVDMRDVLKSFDEKGYYQTYDGALIKKENFNGVYVAGDTEPLTWEFTTLQNRSDLKMNDEDGDGIFEALLHFKNNPYREADGSGYAVWKLQKELKEYPSFHSGLTLLNALYNMSLEEMIFNVREDGAFSAGLKWPGVWTRDISYSIILSLAAVNPDASKASLMAKVKNGKIIQDTGTGGSWPVSTDRMVWAVAAWEIYCVTGDMNWLKQVFQIIKNSAEADLKTVIDPVTGLVYGESSFLDWREQTYPGWMDPKDIYKSQCLGTNAVNYQTYKVLGEMAKILGEESEKYFNTAGQIKNGLKKYLWLDDKGYFAQFLYGRNYFSTSPKSETLGEALAVLFDIAENRDAESIIKNTPVGEFGAPCVYPQTPGIPPYHNNSVWQFVETFWTWASKKSGNEKSVEHGLASIFRGAALFLTNKENMVASNGHYNGTEINSDRQLWSVAGNIAAVYRILFGLEFQKDGLIISPFIPENYASEYTIENFKYRDAVLDISINGFGSQIEKIIFDGAEIKSNKIDAGLKGKHTVEIYLAGNKSAGEINLSEIIFAPEAPKAKIEGNILQWNFAGKNLLYVICRNGKKIFETRENNFDIKNYSGYSEFQVKAVDENGLESFLSEPVVVNNKMLVHEYEPDKKYGIENVHRNFSGGGYIELSKTNNAAVEFNVTVENEGKYAVDFRYANGSGPLNTKNMCAVRSLIVDDKIERVIILPQRGDDVWDNWGYSNSLILNLEKGTHTFKLLFKDYNNNMNEEINSALLDNMRLIRMGDCD
ncbi:MAG: glycogen debranching protein [Ignavibacteriales bacterium]|nr:glycogen debranching protein [Ignavibacteriales bacterium]